MPAGMVVWFTLKRLAMPVRLFVVDVPSPDNLACLAGECMTNFRFRPNRSFEDGGVESEVDPIADEADERPARVAEFRYLGRSWHVLGALAICLVLLVSYVPVPPGGDINYAGLLSLNLPPSLPKGKAFNIVVRQVTNAFGTRRPPPPPPPAIAARSHAAAVAAPALIAWRRVLGAFQLTIPVRNKEVLLLTEERDLSVLRWIGEAIPRHNRWHPVFSRYLHQIAGRVAAFGGDPTLILPSPTGEGLPKHKPRSRPEARIHFTGKVAGLIFDRFGDFDGFLLDTEDGEHSFFTRERDIAQL